MVGRVLTSHGIVGRDGKNYRLAGYETLTKEQVGQLKAACQKKLAEYVDRRMREVAAGGKAVSSFTTAVMAALNIASECHKLQQDMAEIETAIDRLAERLAAVDVKETFRNG